MLIIFYNKFCIIIYYRTKIKPNIGMFLKVKNNLQKQCPNC